jgi:hypothetical protein
MPALIRAPIATRTELQAALDALVGIDVAWLRTHPGTPPLYAAGVRYARERRGLDGRRLECWRPVPAVLRHREGDGEDLACWRVAELQLRGVAARAVPKRTPIGWHIVVQLPNGKQEDPSARLGMPVPGRNRR